jgi:hypothetical protein
MLAREDSSIGEHPWMEGQAQYAKTHATKEIFYSFLTFFFTDKRSLLNPQH